MKKFSLLVLFLAFTATAHAHSPALGLAPETAWQQLLAGNQRFVKGKLKHPNQNLKRLAEIAPKQAPVAVVLSCSDSRLPPEIIFDQGLGDLFTVRIAGNILTPGGIGSIEYAVDHLGPKLIVVLGHERCGAVQATLAGGHLPGDIAFLARHISPSIKKAACPDESRLECSIRANVLEEVKKLKNSNPILAPRIKSGEVKVIGAIYDLDTGVVSVLEPHEKDMK